MWTESTPKKGVLIFPPVVFVFSFHKISDLCFNILSLLFFLHYCLRDKLHTTWVTSAFNKEFIGRKRCGIEKHFEAFELWWW